MGSVSKIDHLLPYVQGMIYANKPMGLSSLSEFKNMLLLIFGREMIDIKVLNLYIIHDNTIALDKVDN
jgi:hypothetical protein